MTPFPRHELNDFLDQILAEDIGAGDATSNAVIPEDAELSARMVARQPMIVAGLLLAEAIFTHLDVRVWTEIVAVEGQQAEAGDVLIKVWGNARAILAAERAALNLIQHLSGIATLTRKYADAIAGSQAQLLDTRKTTPLLRRFEKYATTQGGAKNHRMGLWDAVLIKDNHIAIAGSVGAAVRAARGAVDDRGAELPIEVECDTLDQATEAVAAGAGRLLLDNMSLDELSAAVELFTGKAVLEASGGVRLETIAGIAATGVDYISVGRITQSAPAVDIGLDYG
ncbi:MAG: carboxylating nicotinate-nucleotide diphosphorylase [Sphingomonadales bacterium]